MSIYIDGFVIPVPADKIEEYKKIAKLGAKVWKDHGALEYCECVGDDLDVPCGKPFPKIVKPKEGETIVFSWIVYKSRKHRDEVNKKAINDPRMQKIDPKMMPFDCKRMTMGGFKSILKA